MKKILILAIAMAMMVGSVRAGTYSKQLFYSAPGYDSVIYRLYIEKSMTFVKSDTIRDADYPDSTVVTIYDDSVYLLRSYYYAGTGDPTSGTMSIQPLVIDAQVTAYGSGIDTLRINVLDTSNGDDSLVSSAYVVAVTATGIKGDGFTGDSGWVNLLLTAGTDYTVTARGPSSKYYGATATTFTNTAGHVTTDTLYGYGITAPTAAGSQTCNVQIVLRDNAGNAEEGVWVTARLKRSNVVDSAGYGVVNSTQRLQTNAAGTVTFTCRWSSYLLPATDWIFSVEGVGSMKKTYTVPRETSVTLDLAD